MSGNVENLENINGVKEVREQPPHYVLLLEGPSIETLISDSELGIAERRKEIVMDNLPKWVEVDFTNQIEIFVKEKEE